MPEYADWHCCYIPRTDCLYSEAKQCSLQLTSSSSRPRPDYLICPITTENKPNLPNIPKRTDDSRTSFNGQSKITDRHVPISNSHQYSDWFSVDHREPIKDQKCLSKTQGAHNTILRTEQRDGFHEFVIQYSTHDCHDMVRLQDPQLPQKL